MNRRKVARPQSGLLPELSSITRCALRAAVGSGEVSDDRYDSYRRMLSGEER